MGWTFLLSRQLFVVESTVRVQLGMTQYSKYPALRRVRVRVPEYSVGLIMSLPTNRSRVHLYEYFRTGTYLGTHPVS